MKKSRVVCSVELRTKSGPMVRFCGSSLGYQPVIRVKFLRSRCGTGQASSKLPVDGAKAPVVTVQSASGEESQSPVPPSPYSGESSNTGEPNRSA